MSVLFSYVMFLVIFLVLTGALFWGLQALDLM
uniref:Cytochrome b6-f complex subunit VI n=1 Tax=Hildenbrandia rivularis TaxID=135206 RepID=A0A1C9CFH6_9FLOR|nr:cytochrome b6-f complex subunit VI [Hildenbrandia rivularis]AOM67114.1 cytochrome b6-f complex subunit VI [Hildenbrandia rivularis]